MSRNKKVRQATFDKTIDDVIESEPAVEETIETPAEVVEEPVPVEEIPVETPVEEPVEEEEPAPVSIQPETEKPVEKPVEKPAEKPKSKVVPDTPALRKGEKKTAVVCNEGGKALIIIDASPETVQARWDAEKKTVSAAKFFKALQDEFGVRPITSYKGVSLVLPVTMGLRPNLADADYVELR